MVYRRKAVVVLLTLVPVLMIGACNGDGGESPLHALVWRNAPSAGSRIVRGRGWQSGCFEARIRAEHRHRSNGHDIG